MKLPTWTVMGLAALAIAACDRRVEPYISPELEPPPAREPVRIPGLDNPTPRAPALAVAGDTIRGTLQVEYSGVPTQGNVLFLIARSPGGGPPLAVKRLPVGPFPMKFEIGPSDVMMQGRAFAGPISLSARIDADGDPLTRESREWLAQLDTPVEPGARDVELVLRLSR